MVYRRLVGFHGNKHLFGFLLLGHVGLEIRIRHHHLAGSVILIELLASRLFLALQCTRYTVFAGGLVVSVRVLLQELIKQRGVPFDDFIRIVFSELSVGGKFAPHGAERFIVLIYSVKVLLVQRVLNRINDAVIRRVIEGFLVRETRREGVVILRGLLVHRDAINLFGGLVNFVHGVLGNGSIAEVSGGRESVLVDNGVQVGSQRPYRSLRHGWGRIFIVHRLKVISLFGLSIHKNGWIVVEGICGVRSLGKRELRRLGKVFRLHLERKIRSSLRGNR